MKRFIFLALFPVALLACDKRSDMNFEASEKGSLMMSPAAIEKEFEVPKAERMLVRNGQMQLSSHNLVDTRRKIESLCKQFNAYVSSEEQQKFDRKIQFEQVIRIPSSRFDAFIKAIESMDVKIDSRNFTSQDVTEEYIDVEARLKAKKELESRYIQLLAKAKNVTEMLSIETQISGVRTEIESMQARTNFLNNRVGHSTLTLVYYESLGSDPGFGSKLAHSFISGWTGLLSFLVGVTSIWPFVILLAASFWLISKWIRRMNLRSAGRDVE